MDSEAGEAVGSEMLRYGQRISVVALPAPELFLTPKGLAAVGPRAFGYDFDYKPSVTPSVARGLYGSGKVPRCARYDSGAWCSGRCRRRYG